ncbi:MAG: M23 family metallopeptidase [Alphaproteobacteria bacterium]|nr:M23 family metallopeptidase [Alphaproteobacteria bacterium]
MMNFKQIAVIAVAILGFGTLVGCVSRSGPPASVIYDKKNTPYHIVKKGDSIASIARKYGMSKRELIRINELESPYRIVKGQRLLVRAHKPSVAQKSKDIDETEIPATEEVSSVPEDDEVQVRPLAPVAGLPTDSGLSDAQRGAVESGGKLNPETDEEMDQDSVSDGQGKKTYDEDNIDEAERQTKRPKYEQSSGMPSAPPASSSYTWPAQGKVIRNFNPSGKGKNQNDGINISAPKGTKVVAVNNGVVAHAGNQLRGFGNVVLVKHDNGLMSVYAHLNEVFVQKGDVVSAGQELGTVGQTGNVKEPQLHIEMREGRKPVNPEKYLGSHGE